MSQLILIAHFHWSKCVSGKNQLLWAALFIPFYPQNSSNQLLKISEEYLLNIPGSQFHKLGDRHSCITLNCSPFLTQNQLTYLLSVYNTYDFASMFFITLQYIFWPYQMHHSQGYVIMAGPIHIVIYFKSRTPIT